MSVRKKEDKRNLIEYCGNCLSRLIRKKEKGWERVYCPKCGLKWQGRLENGKDKEM